MTDMMKSDLWERYQRHLCICKSIDLTLDVSRMTFDDAYLQRMWPAMDAAFKDMDALEKGAIANPDEKRMVGHYWLRAAGLAPNRELTSAIKTTVARIKAFAADGMGAMFAPTAVANVIAKRYGLAVVAEIDEVRDRFYAISAERRLAHPAVVAIQHTARRDVFG